jgi:predicted SAM-dependent methyltransferase
MPESEQVVAQYLRGSGPHKLEIGAGSNGKPGWLATDLDPPDVASVVPIIAMDATKDFPIPSDSFDYVYTEHMIEHISFVSGQDMLSECHRILKPGGVLRVVTPALGFLFRIMASDRSLFEERYRTWSIERFLPSAPAVTNAFFLNNFMRAWGHTFIYDHETLRLAMKLAGFDNITEYELNESERPELRGLENESRMPKGFLALESMVMEGVKGDAPSLPAQSGSDLALGKPATQSSISPWSREDSPEKDAARLVNGLLSGSYNNHTGLDDPPWWRVDLGQTCSISQIWIYNRSDNREIMQRASRFEIQISDDDQGWRTVFRKDSDELVRGSHRGPFIWTPQETVRARFVRIQLLRRQFLHLDQVKIFGEA